MIQIGYQKSSDLAVPRCTPAAPAPPAQSAAPAAQPAAPMPSPQPAPSQPVPKAEMPAVVERCWAALWRKCGTLQCEYMVEYSVPGRGQNMSE